MARRVHPREQGEGGVLLLHRDHRLRPSTVPTTSGTSSTTCPSSIRSPGMAFGQRWVSTPACRAARAVDGDLLAPVHYVTLYLMTEPVDEHPGGVRCLSAASPGGRPVPPAPSGRSVGPLRRRRRRPPPRASSISAEAVPYRPNRGAYVVVEDCPPTVGHAEAPDADVDPPRDRYRRNRRRPARRPRAWPVCGASSPTRSAGNLGARDADRITVCFLDEPPLAVAPGPRRGGHGGWRPTPDAVIHAGPLETIVPWHWDWFDDEQPSVLSPTAPVRWGGSGSRSRPRAGAGSRCR